VVVLRLLLPGAAADAAEVGDRVTGLGIGALGERHVAGGLGDAGGEVVVMLEVADRGELLQRVVAPVLEEMVADPLHVGVRGDVEREVGLPERRVVRLLALAVEVLARLHGDGQRKAVAVRQYARLQRAGERRVVLDHDPPRPPVAAHAKANLEILVRIGPERLEAHCQGGQLRAQRVIAGVAVIPGEAAAVQDGEVAGIQRLRLLRDARPGTRRVGRRQKRHADATDTRDAGTRPNGPIFQRAADRQHSQRR
jgi:hypothetical protein